MSVTLDVNALLGGGASLAVIGGGLAAGYWGLRRWVQRAATPAQAAADQLKTSNGTTVAGYVEKTSQQIGEVQVALASLAAQSDANRDLATSALTLAKHAHERLDLYLISQEHPRA